MSLRHFLRSSFNTCLQLPLGLASMVSMCHQAQASARLLLRLLRLQFLRVFLPISAQALAQTCASSFRLSLLLLLPSLPPQLLLEVLRSLQQPNASTRPRQPQEPETEWITNQNGQQQTALEEKWLTMMMTVVIFDFAFDSKMCSGRETCGLLVKQAKLQKLRRNRNLRALHGAGCPTCHGRCSEPQMSHLRRGAARRVDPSITENEVSLFLEEPT